MQFFHVSITFVALELDSPAQIEKKSIFLSCIGLLTFYKENTNELAIMLKNGKIHFFSIWAGESNSRATKSDWHEKKLDFLNFQNFSLRRFWAFLTHFWVGNVHGGYTISKECQIRPVCFLLETGSKVVKIDQNKKFWKLRKSSF